MSFAENFIKGIPHKEHLTKEGGVATHLFEFKTSATRTDQLLEQSINWEDQEGVAAFTLQQTKSDGTILFREGLVKIPLEEIKQINKRPSVNNVISYERQPLDNNPYHGNLLIPESISKPTRNQISAAIAIVASKLIKEISQSPI